MTKSFLISIITLFLLTGVTGCDCDKDNAICTFNVNDPVNDLGWLKNEITTRDIPGYYVRFYLYQNKENPQKYFFHEEIQIVGGGQQSMTGFSYIVIYNCKGDATISTKYYSSSSTEALNNFYIENTLVNQIWPKE